MKPPRGVPTGTRREFLAFTQHDIAPSELGQMEQHAASDHAAANNYDPRMALHPASRMRLCEFDDRMRKPPWRTGTLAGRAYLLGIAAVRSKVQNGAEITCFLREKRPCCGKRSRGYRPFAQEDSCVTVEIHGVFCFPTCCAALQIRAAAHGSAVLVRSRRTSNTPLGSSAAAPDRDVVG